MDAAIELCESSRNEQPTLMGGSGGYEAFFRMAQAAPLFTLDEERDFIRRAQSGDDIARERVFISHLRLVIRIAREFKGYGQANEDLIQEGVIGMMDALDNYDEGHGTRFSSYSMIWIRAAIHKYCLNNLRSMRILTTKSHYKIFYRMGMQRNWHGSLSNEQIISISKLLNVDEEEVRDVELRLANTEICLDAPTGEDAFAPIDRLEDYRLEPTEVLQGRERDCLMGPALTSALDSLDPRSRRIVEARWIYDEEDALTLKDLAVELGVSMERVRQIEASALHKMRKCLTAYV